MNKILLCCDLDRTLLPNGEQQESPEARPLLRRLGQCPQLALAYVSGRDRSLLLDAIHAYDLPVPDYAIGDVGTTLYRIEHGQWEPWHAWEDQIRPDWADHTGDALAAVLQGLDRLRPQEPEKQNTFKLSYYAPYDSDRDALLAEVEARLQALGVRASLIWSIDEPRGLGLLDVLPASATKYHAIRFLMKQEGFAESRTVFAGDSGNDLPVLTSGLQSVLVRNASPAVREEALAQVRARGLADRLYIARGGFLGMNGHYAAGVLEGLAHFLPETQHWMMRGCDQTASQ